jgi:hypothetical protein
MDFSQQKSLFMIPLLILPLFTATLYLSSICPTRPHCFLLTMLPRSQTLYCESNLACSGYRVLLFISSSIVLATVLVGFLWGMARYAECLVVESVIDEDTERGWNTEFDDEATDCEDEILPCYKD